MDIENIIAIKQKATGNKHKAIMQIDGVSIYMYGGKVIDMESSSFITMLPYFKPFVNQYLIIFYNADNGIIYNYGKQHGVNIGITPKPNKEFSKQKQQFNKYSELLSHYILTQAVVEKK